MPVKRRSLASTQYAAELQAMAEKPNPTTRKMPFSSVRLTHVPEDISRGDICAMVRALRDIMKITQDDPQLNNIFCIAEYVYNHLGDGSNT